MCRLQTEGDKEQNIKELKEAADANFGDGKLAKMRTWVWESLEKPWTSTFAKHYACFSLFMVVISTVTFVISTSEEVQVCGLVLKIQCKVLMIQADEDGEEYPLVLQVIDAIDMIAVVFFSLEYFIRLLVSPDKLKFFPPANEYCGLYMSHTILHFPSS